MKAITLVETANGYNVMLHGNFHGDLYFNMTGYTGCYLPLPPTAERNGKIGHLDIGERSIGVYRKKIASLNREWQRWEQDIHHSDGAENATFTAACCKDG